MKLQDLITQSDNPKEKANARNYLSTLMEMQEGAARGPRKAYVELRKQLEREGKTYYLFESMPEGIGYVVIQADGEDAKIKGPIPYKDIANEPGWEDTVADRDSILDSVKP